MRMQHGGDLSKAAAEFGGSEKDWLDLSTGINPIAYPALNHITSRGLADLPNARAEAALIASARAAYSVPIETGLAAAPGTQAIITALPQILSPNSSIAIVSPTYSSHEESWKTAGAKTQLIGREDIHHTDTDHLLLVNPNNPDGHIFSKQELLEIAASKQKNGGFLIVDEAFMDLYPEASIIPELGSLPILVLRSFGKFFGLAGLRLGALVGPQRITKKLQKQLGSWAISGPALDVGHAAFSDITWQAEMRTLLKIETDLFRQVLFEHQVSIVGQTDLYTLIEYPLAHQLHEALARKQVWTRVFNYNKNWMRLGLPVGAENRLRFANALKTSLNMLENHARL
ncbi:Threonine-phosphate decarboxylase [Pseudovibrio axinellae]|uniref:threonine-phosphate decarboxylase n=1 Tax=Pseudovibrio axinellae TaxID=989403 RepID=A0A166B191_9HYPH|nr:threonine-phosphate decarboxylase CobD [Pseudovibrio axinellae]KZL21808.1 Threonine-phosphate decarboxylase [Pseudovibrio axinellae]SEQ79329.1 L-threonine O-3-phosphate decarboxylase [Pseudovibrio axinellae]